MRGTGLDRVAFTQAYEAKISRLRKAYMLPNGLRQRIEAARESFSDGSRRLLEDVNRRYEDRKAFYEPSFDGYDQYLPEPSQDHDPLALYSGQSAGGAT